MNIMESLKNRNAFPKGWLCTTLEEILLTLESGSRPKGGVRDINTGIPSLGGEHLLYNGKFDFTKIRYIPGEFYKKMARGKIMKNDILVVKDGATTGKASYVSDCFPFNEAAVNEHVFILRVFKGYTIPGYLSFWMQSIFGQNCVKENFQGTAQGGINSNFVKKSNFPLPPLAEQRRIVAKIEELFTRLDAGVEILKKVRARIKRFRQAVLKAAFEGKLTEEWRKKHKNEIEPSSVLLQRIKEAKKKAANKKYKEIPLVDTSDLPGLPEGWAYRKLEEITSVLGDGLHGTPVYSETGEYYFINGNNLSDGSIEIKGNTKRISVGEYEKYKKTLNEKTIFVSINGTLGNTAFFNGEKIILGKSACYFNVLDAVNKQYVRYCITSNRFITYANKNATGSTIKNVGLKAMREFEIPLPTTEKEQSQIVSEIERHFAAADEAEKNVEQSLRQAERLRQSILKKSFEGRLVPQDPSDEPAEELLRKIKKEREILEASKKGKKKYKNAD